MQKRFREIGFLALLLLLMSNVVFAGGISIIRDSVFFESHKTVFKPRDQIRLSFRANDYLYGSSQFAYAVLAVVPDKASLNPPRGELPDWDIYGILAGLPSRNIGLDEGARPYVLKFFAPERPGKYKVVLSRVPLIRDSEFKTGRAYKQSFIPHTQDRNEMSVHVTNYPGSNLHVAAFEVSAEMVEQDESPRIYLQVNGSVPSAATFEGGVQKNPIRFSWSIGPEFKKDKDKMVFRYRLAPEDNQWGAWTTQTEVHYSFLLRGVHRFEVEAKYQDGADVLMSWPAKFQFTLPENHVSQPTRESLTKAPFGTLAQASRSIEFGEVYPSSKALVIGMWSFDDAESFPVFDENKIAADVLAMESALKINGFEVTTLFQSRVSREDIATALNKLVNSADRNDRLFVYFSTHGFPDPVLPSEGYLATSDCELSNPGNRCLRLNDLQTYADRALEGKQVRQILFAVDSCFSGLGITRKTSVGIQNLTRLAVPQGAFMLTAGMANQEAQIDPELGMSTFTHFLAEGLSGEANIVGDGGLITMSELFVFVQYNVALKTDASQIPMLGRMSGDGEMLFLPVRRQ